MSEVIEKMSDMSNNEILFLIKQLEADLYYFYRYLLIWKQKHKNL